MRMAESGDMLDLSAFGALTVDKHSSGGVGDKTTLIVAPIAAAAGCVVAKMSGRGLGFTGGTIDKLESIHGFSTQMSPDEFFDCAKEHGIVVAGQTGNMAPCDKKLYALRDVTATVDSMPLIASSIMSKKIAAGSKNIVLDIKCGSGAFMHDITSARRLAKEMVSIGKHCGRNTAAFVTDMSAPLGRAVGNSLEVREAVDVLKGDMVSDIYALCIALSGRMISLVKNIDFEEGKFIASDMLASGKAFDKLCEMVTSQGGSADSLYQKRQELDCISHTVTADRDGYILQEDALDIGKASVLLGAGRSVKEDSIDPLAGIYLHKKVGDRVKKGDKIFTLYSSSEEKVNSAMPLVSKAVVISDEKVRLSNIILDYLS